MTRLVRCGAIGLALTLSGPRAAGSDRGGLPWIPNLKDALEQAGKARRPILMDVWAVWCVPCKAMDDTTYADPAVKAEAEGFVLAKVDADVQAPVIQRYGIDAYPTVLFLDAAGKEIARLTGYRGPADLSARMKAVREGYARYEAYRREDGDDDFMGDYLAAAGNPDEAAEHYRRAAKALDGDPPRRDAEEMKLARAFREGGQVKQAAAIYDRLSRSSSDPARRAEALQALIRTQIAMGKRKDAEASLARLANEHPELVRDYREMMGNAAAK